MRDTATKLFDSHQQVALLELLSSCSPAAAILLNLQISLSNEQLHEEGVTLSRTLFPFLNKVTDYSFLGPESHFIMNRFLNSLIRHLCDTRGKVALGFMLFALHVNPLVIKDIIGFEGNVLALSSALVKQGFPPEAATIMALEARKFLYPELMKFWKGKTEEVVIECSRILQKMDVLADPGPLMTKFLDCCNQRRLVVDLLLTAPSIKLSMPRLLIVLQRLATMGADTITACLSSDSAQWEGLTQKQASKEDRAEAQLKTESVVEFFQEMTKGLGEVVPLKAVNDMSKEMSEEVEGYHHCEYQAAVAAISLSHHDPLIVVVSPTGSGKTWMQGLIAKYHCSQRKSVTVIEPNDVLRV